MVRSYKDAEFILIVRLFVEDKVLPFLLNVTRGEPFVSWSLLCISGHLESLEVRVGLLVLLCISANGEAGYSLNPFGQGGDRLPLHLNNQTSQVYP